MDEATSTAVEWADECIDMLDTLVIRFHTDSPGPDVDPNTSETGQKVSQPEIIDAVTNTIASILGVVEACKPSSQPRLNKPPPSWWQKTEMSLREKAPESARAARALSLLKKLYSCTNGNVNGDMLALALVACDGDWKLSFEIVPRPFRGIGEPNSDQRLLFINFEIDDDIRNTLPESSREVLPVAEWCQPFLRRLIDDLSTFP